MASVTNSTTTTTTHYLVDPTGVLPQALVEYPSVGTPTYYIPAGTLIGQDQGGAIGLNYFAIDGLGSVRATFDKTGSKTGLVNYDPYGSILPDPGASVVASHIGYTGALTDANGLVYLNARYYNPGDGQFLSSHPIAGQPADPGSFNLYGYVQGNPVNASDPSGNSRAFNNPGDEGEDDCELDPEACEPIIDPKEVNTYTNTSSGATGNPTIDTVTSVSDDLSDIFQLVPCSMPIG